MSASVRSEEEPGANKPAECSIFKDVGVNDLSINDIVVKSPKGDLSCIKARFSLAIKVEAVITPVEVSTEEPENDLPNDPDTETKKERITLGYLPLDSVKRVDDSCPDESEPTPNPTREADKKLLNSDELRMVVEFECGEMTFNFKRDEKFQLSSIEGLVKLGKLRWICHH